MKYSMNDQFFTPSEIATRLVAPFRRSSEKCIADFAAGDGELLRAAGLKWPRAKIIASDIDEVTVRSLKKDFPRWAIGKCDFLNERSRQRCNPISSVKGKITLLLLNPPFSC